MTLRATTDPTFALKGALLRPNVKPRAAITNEKKLGGLLRSIFHVARGEVRVSELRWLRIIRKHAQRLRPEGEDAKAVKKMFAEFLAIEV